MNRFSLALLALLSLTACEHSDPVDSPAAEAEGKRFLPPATDYAAVYIFRTAMAGSVPFALSLNQNNLGTLPYMTWLRVDVQPGDYDVVCTPTRTGAAPTSLHLHLSVNSITYLQADYRSFETQHCWLSVDAPFAAQPTILASHRAAATN